MQDLTITYIQADLLFGDIQGNLEKFGGILSGLQGKQDLVCFPEMFSTGFCTAPEKVSELPGSRTMLWMQEMARKTDCIICGSVIIREGGHYYNRLIWMRPDGSYESSDKRHLFTMGNEHLRFTAGKKRLVTEIKGWKVRPLVCYDLRFPVWSKNTYKSEQYEYDLLIYLANWPDSRRQVWKSLLTARAIENSAFCLGVNRIGSDGNGLSYTGDSGLYDYKGQLISSTPENEEEIVTITLNAGELCSFREKFNVGPDWDEFKIKL